MELTIELLLVAYFITTNLIIGFWKLVGLIIKKHKDKKQSNSQGQNSSTQIEGSLSPLPVETPQVQPIIVPGVQTPKIKLETY